MKIPDSSNNGYYVNEENGAAPWQNNGVIIDGVVTNMGGVVAGGDAGYMPPVYTVPRSMPQGPGYVMGAPYFPMPDEDFSEYMWMENEEEFDKQVMQQLEEEALMEQCIEAMLDEERRSGGKHTTNNGVSSLAEAVSRSTLNPLAAEFVPTRSTSAAPAASETQALRTQQDITEKPEAAKVAATPPPTAAKSEEPKAEVKTDDLRADDNDASSESGKSQAMGDLKQTKSEPKTSCGEGKSKKGTTKVTKSDVKVTPKAATDAQPATTTPSQPAEEVKLEETPVVAATTPQVQKTEAPAPPKPINYAMAARSNKPKKAAAVAVAPAQPQPVEAKATKPAADSKAHPKARKNSGGAK